MDLISREAAISAAKHAWAKGLEPSQYIEIIPSVPAVPMDKLCALLGKNADCPPEHSPVQDHCMNTKCAECWKLVLKEWMEEQDAGN